MDIGAFVESLEEVQKQILPVHEKEEQIGQVIDGVKGSGSLSDFLTFLLKSSHCRRIIQIIEQYPEVYKNILDEPTVHNFLHEANALKDNLIIQNVISMISIALGAHNHTESELSSITTTSLIDFALQWIKIEELVVAERASNLLLSITQAFDRSVHQMSELMNALYDRSIHVKSDSTLLLRYLAFAVKLSKNSETSMNSFISSKLFALLYELCRSDDLLAAINGIEYLAEITKGPGANIILLALSHPVTSTKGSELPSPISWLTSLCQEANNPSFDPFLRDTSMRTLILIFNNAVICGYGFIDMDFTQLVQVSTELLEDRSADITSRLSGLGVISDLAQVSSYWFRQIIFPAHDPALRTLSAWMSLLHTGKSELVAAGLFAVAHVLLRPDSVYAAAAEGSVVTSERPTVPNAAEMSELKRRLVNTIGIARNNTTLKFLLLTARQPVSPLRIAAMDVLHAMVVQPWGFTVLAPTISTEAVGSSTSSIAQSEFLQYLVDRTTEIDKEGKDAKFEIVLAVKNSASFQLLSVDTQVAIDRMIAQGAYYMPALLGEMQTI